MYKTTSNKQTLKHNDFFTMVAALTALSFIMAWAVELLAMELFRLG